jgi:hypothetical protein
MSIAGVLLGQPLALTATENEDWAFVLEVCERASASEADAKEAFKAFRVFREKVYLGLFKYATYRSLVASPIPQSYGLE